ncbi:MAG: hypothetical protein AABZ06_05830 [Bdellovibrionota bacterium]
MEKEQEKSMLNVKRAIHYFLRKKGNQGTPTKLTPCRQGDFAPAKTGEISIGRRGSSMFLLNIPLSLIATMLLFGILAFYFMGVKIAKFKKLRDPESKADGVGPLEGALLGLLALLLSFTFGQSASRFDDRRALIIQESNDIGTVILRSDLYPDAIGARFKEDLKKYVEKRIVYYHSIDEEKINRARVEAEEISTRLWKMAVTLSKNSPNIIRDNQMIPALNAMIDIVTSRDASRLASVPSLIVYLLVSLIVLGSFIVGYSRKTKKHDWVILSMYAFMTTATTCAILDLDRPRQGMIETAVTHEKISSLLSYF